MLCRPGASYTNSPQDGQCILVDRPQSNRSVSIIRGWATLDADRLTVECTDPSDLFDTVQPLLAQRLPLRDLNWKSPNRPLRSIASLDVDFFKAKERSSDALQENGSAQRRHQIPGLRKTPYLKIYLLRCDDKDAYKNTSRKLVREWVKTITQSSGSSIAGGSDGHDACEWLILHVVLPNTPAASEPRTSKRSSDGPSDSTESIPGKSKWPGKGTSTVLEKIKADFNGTSKSSFDRVAQIRLSQDGQPQSALSMGLTQSEVASMWQDITEKIKTSVLTSFDMRVRQYEEDIRERDSQRSLPGWNFCTFFILKEGLAIGFEEVGLLEDALVGYDELAYGLDVIIREQTAGEGDETGGSLSLSTASLQSELKSLLEAPMMTENKGEESKNQSSQSLSFQLAADEFPLDPNSKPYRELILANQISIFDFRVYIFGRQLSLLLKAAKNTDSPSKNAGNEDFILLAEICHRATEFIGIGSRTLREDLQQGLKQEKTVPSRLTEAQSVIQNIALSWIYCVAMQILTQTSSTALKLPASGITDPEVLEVQNGVEHQDRSPSPGSQQSYLTASNEESGLQPGLHRQPSYSQANGQGRRRPSGSKTGTEELASARGELYLTARRVLQNIGSAKSWRTDWEDLGTISTDDHVNIGDMQDVSLEDNDNAGVNEVSEMPFTTKGLQNPQLRAGVSTAEDFKILFNALTDQAYRHFLASNKSKSAESLLADVAIQKYRAQDYSTAAPLFRRLTAFYESESWSILTGVLLELYAKSTKQLKNGPEYVSSLIQLLAFWAQKRRFR